MRETVAAAVHGIHGTRGLTAGGAGLLLLALIEPAIGPSVPKILFVGPVFLVLLIGLLTLPREGVAAQHRTQALLDDPAGAKKMAKRLGWPIALCVVLSPQFFLAAYGIPPLNPLAGVLLPQMQRRVTLTVLFCILLLAVFYVRSSKGYARHILAKRPKDLQKTDRSHQERDLLLALLIVLGAIWGFLLQPFWQPFSLAAWPPSLSSLEVGVRGVSSISFALTIPLMLFMSLVAHAHLLWTVFQERSWQQHQALVALAAVHVALIALAIVLHGYDLLWIVQYRLGSRL